MTDFWFGDIAVGFLTEKDTEVSKEVIEKNFVEHPPDVFELNKNLESGSYSVILNQEVHPRAETLAEQRDAVVSMADRHMAEFPFEQAGDKGHVLIESSNVTITPSQMIDEGEITIRFMEDETYQPAITVDPSAFDGNFDPTPHESVVALPDTVQNVTDINGNSLTPEFSDTSEDGTLDYYLYSDRQTIVYDRATDYSSDERVAPARVYTADDDRVYSSNWTLTTDSYAENGLIRATYGSSNTSLSVYDGSWRSIGSVNPSVDYGYARHNENYETELSFVSSFDTTHRKGYPVVQFDIDGITNFTFSSNEDLTTTDTSSSWYRVVTNTSGDDIVLIRTSNDGSFSDTSSVLEVTGLDSSTEYTFLIGTIPENETIDNFTRYAYNIGRWDRTMVQR